jgi:hypothetical protein
MRFFLLNAKKSQYTLEVKIQTKNASDYVLRFSPCFAEGTRILEIGVNSSPISFKTDKHAQNVFPIAEIPIRDKSMLIEMDFIPTLEILPVIQQTLVGENNKGLKIISVRRENSQLIIDLKGLSGQKHEIRIRNGEQIREVTGAEYSENKLKIQIPAGLKKEFIPHQIKILLKE